MYESLLMLEDNLKGLVALIKIGKEDNLPELDEKVSIDNKNYLVISAYDLRPAGPYMELVISEYDKV